MAEHILPYDEIGYLQEAMNRYAGRTIIDATQSVRKGEDPSDLHRQRREFGFRYRGIRQGWGFTMTDMVIHGDLGIDGPDYCAFETGILPPDDLADGFLKKIDYFLGIPPYHTKPDPRP